MVDDSSEVSVWRPTKLLRVSIVGGVVLCFALGMSMIGDAADEDEIWPAVAFVLVFIGIPQLVLLRHAFRARVEVRPDALIIATTFSKHRIEWSEVVDAAAGYAGVTVVLRSGTTRVAGAVQKSNFSTWTNRRTRADVLCDLILARAHNASA